MSTLFGLASQRAKLFKSGSEVFWNAQPLLQIAFFPAHCRPHVSVADQPAITLPSFWRSVRIPNVSLIFPVSGRLFRGHIDPPIGSRSTSVSAI